MFGRRKADDDSVYDPRARAGVSLLALITGTAVAFGTILVLTVAAGAWLTAEGVTPEDFGRNEAIRIGLGAGIALLVVQLVAYMWGGYTAGRMGRGAGVAHGLLVPTVGLAVMAIVGGVSAATNAEAYLPPLSRLPVEGELMVNYGIGTAVALLIAMFLGGIIGGILGARWHTKLEREAGVEEGMSLRQREPVVTRTDDDDDTAVEDRPVVRRTR